MKFMVDRCAGRRLAEWLRAGGHDVVESRQLGADPGDLALLQHAAREQRILVTIDTDFGKLIYSDETPHHGLVRLPDVPAEKRIALFQTLLTDHAVDLEAGAVITIRGSRIRVSRQGPEGP
jgi:predicted nuclease of predicted toxin-antitoxin system